MKLHLKKWPAILLVLCLLLTAACGKDGEKDDPSESADASVSENGSDAGEDVTKISDEVLPAGINPLTGKSGYDDAMRDKKAVAIVVENHPAARPQWGMSTPDILMEYEVEGGISRMLWLYADASRVPDKVGPVRSARHDVVELARGWDLVFIHCGGSPEALSLIGTYGGALSELDVMQREAGTYRDTTRSVSYEHKLILQGSKLENALESAGVSTAANPATRAPLIFADENAPRTLSGGDADKIHFAYSGYYVYDFTYENGRYTRAINGSVMTDDTGAVCAYDNVLILYVDMVSRNDDAGHQDLLLEKGGRGVYFNGGRYETVRWEKGEGADPLRLLDEQGNALVLNPGQSYIGFVRSTQESVTKY